MRMIASNQLLSIDELWTWMPHGGELCYLIMTFVLLFLNEYVFHVMTNKEQDITPWLLQKGYRDWLVL